MYEIGHIKYIMILYELTSLYFYTIIRNVIFYNGESFLFVITFLTITTHSTMIYLHTVVKF